MLALTLNCLAQFFNGSCIGRIDVSEKDDFSIAEQHFDDDLKGFALLFDDRLRGRFRFFLHHIVDSW